MMNHPSFPIRKNRNFKFAHLSTGLLILWICLSLPSALPSQNWDVRWLQKINSHYTEEGNRWVAGFEKSVALFSAGVPVGMVAVSYLQNDGKLRNKGTDIFIGELLAYGITMALKYGVDRQRPYQRYPGVKSAGGENTPSFPSGHTTGSFVLAMGLSLQMKNLWVTLGSFAWATAVAVGRVYQGVHYPSDVLMGAFIGSAVAYGVYRWEPSRRLFGEKNGYSIQYIPQVPTTRAHLIGISWRF